MRRLLLITLTPFLLPTTASAAADIEAVWNFNGGQVAIEQQADGTFLGTVIRDTSFSQCTHRAGERMWTEIRPQADGSYWGKHQWFNSDCTLTEPRGNTAWRVLRRPDGTRFLRACSMQPSDQTTQPTIAPDGTSAGHTGSCDDSDFARDIPAATPKVDSIVTLPRQGRRRCLSKRSFRIRLREPEGDKLDTASVFVNGRRVATRKSDRITAPVNLRGLPKGRYTVKIVATTVRGKTIQGSRKYRTCSARRRGGGGRL